MKILFIGDIVGEKSLDFVIENLPTLYEKYNTSFTIVNGENIDKGKGLNQEQADMLFNAKVDIITTGNHIWENWSGRPLLAKEPRVLRPMNYPAGNAGLGFNIVDIGSDKIAVLQLQGRTYMQTIDCPFKAADFALKKIHEHTNNIIVDFHAEATAEKIAMGWYLDGKVSAVLGTHTHIPTADANILPNGTAFISDVGMSGPFDSVVGMRKDVAIKRLTLQTAHKYEMAENDIKISAVVVDIDTATGQALRIQQITYPSFTRSVFDNL
jgi:metallophosphoesterase (TIGR00282 family)